MNDLIEMALDAGFLQKSASIFLCNTDCLKDFEALIRADEREACAKVCDDWPNGRDDVYSIGVAIRARGNT